LLFEIDRPGGEFLYDVGLAGGAGSRGRSRPGPARRPRPALRERVGPRAAARRLQTHPPQRRCRRRRAHAR
jgi:hypothetical protein